MISVFTITVKSTKQNLTGSHAANQRVVRVFSVTTGDMLQRSAAYK